jgi:UDP-glucose 4-epimerase
VLDNFSTGHLQNLSDILDDIEVIDGDIRDLIQVAKAVKDIDFIFHHAAQVSVPLSMKKPQECFEINVQGTLNILEAARGADVQQIVQASSSAVYGEAQELPVREEINLQPLSPYAASKQVNEVYGGLYTRAFNLPIVSLRYFNVYGPRQAPDSPYAAAIPIFIRRLLNGQPPTVFGDGYQRRDFIFVGDVVRANLLAAECPQAAGEALNVCSGKEISIIDLLEALAKILPDGPAPEFASPRAGDIYRSAGSPLRAEQVLNFIPRTSLSEGLAQTIDWMRNDFS